MRKIIAPLLVLALLLWGCSHAPEKRSAVGFYFDTVVTLTAYCDQDLLDEALAECATYEALLSKTKEGSDVWRVNHAGGQPTLVSDDTVSILETARHVSELSGGAFDVTVANATALWDFSGKSGLPDPELLKKAAALTDYTKIQVNGNTVTLPEGMQIDLGGVAKGYIADRIAQFLSDRGVHNAVLNFGGNVVTIGGHPDGAPWKIGVQDPKGENGDSLLTVTSEDSSVVTSGIYQRFFTLDGVTYHHVLDTSTGWPVQNELDGVTVLSESSALGDALSTAFLALGEEKALQLAAQIEGVEIICVTRSGEVVMSEGASGRLAE